MVAAETQHGMAAWQLASNAMARSDSLGVEPLPQHDGMHVDAISNHGDVNVGRVRQLQKTVPAESGGVIGTHSPMIFTTTRLDRRPSHSP